MRMLVNRLCITTEVDGFERDMCYRVMGLDFDERFVHFLVVDEEGNFRVLDDKDCKFYKCNCKELDCDYEADPEEDEDEKEKDPWEE